MAKNNIRNEKRLSDITKLIEESGAETQEEINAVLSKMMNNQFDDNDDNEEEELSIEEESQDLVYQAQEAETYKEAKNLINKSLKLDPNNIDAILFVAEHETNPSRAIAIYQKAVSAGRKTLGEEFFEENTGHFWGMLETRPFMRAMLQLGGAYYVKDMHKKALDLYDEMLVLCPSDNLGVRYLYATLLLEMNLLEDLEAFYDKSEEEEDNANYNYSKAILQFKKEGQSKKADKLLLKAITQNSAVAGFLLGEKEITTPLPEYITHGEEDEAMVYAIYNIRVWKKTPNAFEWISNFSDTRKSIN